MVRIGRRWIVVECISRHWPQDPWSYLTRGEKEERTLASLRYGDHHLNHFIFENNQVSEGLHLLNVQAGLNLVDNVEADGGFQCVPGFRHHFKVRSAACFRQMR